MSFLNSAFVFLILANPSGMPSQASESVKIKAKTVEVHHEARHASLVGEVSVSWGKLSLTADRVKVQYAKTGEPTRWTASGSVQVTWRTYTLTSDTLEIAQTKETLVFRGPLNFSQGRQNWRAKQATLNLKTKQLSIREVEGEMHFQELLKSP